MDFTIDTIPSEAMAVLCRWPWPGNVRELENVMERAVIQSKGSLLQVPLHEFRQAPQSSGDHAITLEDAERDHILKALLDTDWIIGGPGPMPTLDFPKRETDHPVCSIKPVRQCWMRFLIGPVLTNALTQPAPLQSLCADIAAQVL